MMRYGNGDKWEGNFDVNIVHEFKNGEVYYFQSCIQRFKPNNISF